jgi:hypothetical protein
MSANPQKGPLPRLPMVTALQSRAGSTSGDPKLVNAFAERLEDGTHRVTKRQGAALYQTLTPPAGTSFVSGGMLGSFFAEDLTSLTGNPVPLVLTFVNTTDNITHTNAVYVYFNGASPLLIPFGANTPQPPGFICVQYTPKLVAAVLRSSSAGVIPLIATIDLVARTAVSFLLSALTNKAAIGFVELDNTMYLMDTLANIVGSALNDAQTWPALNTVQANSEPGAGVYLAKHHAYIVAMKEFSMEFLYDANNPTGSPLSPVNNSTILWGCVDGNTVQALGDRIFWLARERQGAYFIAALENMQHGKISTPGIDKIVGDSTGPYYSFVLRDSQGHQFYGLTDAGVGYTVIYDIGEKLWYIWNSPGTAYFPYSNFIVHSNNTIIMQSTVPGNVGKLYQLDEDFTVDVDGSFDVDIYTPNTDLGTRRRKVLMRMDFITDQQPAFLRVRFSEDDFKSFSQFRQVDLNVKRPTLTNCGTFRRRAYHIHHNAPYPLRLEAIELDVLLGV